MSSYVKLGRGYLEGEASVVPQTGKENYIKKGGRERPP
jgi:hypothetical protein